MLSSDTSSRAFSADSPPLWNLSIDSLFCKGALQSMKHLEPSSSWMPTCLKRFQCPHWSVASKMNMSWPGALSCVWLFEPNCMWAAMRMPPSTAGLHLNIASGQCAQKSCWVNGTPWNCSFFTWCGFTALIVLKRLPLASSMCIYKYSTWFFMFTTENLGSRLRKNGRCGPCEGINIDMASVACLWRFPAAERLRQSAGSVYFIKPCGCSWELVKIQNDRTCKKWTCKPGKGKGLLYSTLKQSPQRVQLQICSITRPDQKNQIQTALLVLPLILGGIAPQQVWEKLLLGIHGETRHDLAVSSVTCFHLLA